MKLILFNHFDWIYFELAYQYKILIVLRDDFFIFYPGLFRCFVTSSDSNNVTILRNFLLIVPVGVSKVSQKEVILYLLH